MKLRAGFTIVELVITITIIAILLTLGVVNLQGSQANARDEERKTDVRNIALYLEGIYENGTSTDPSVKGTYPVVSAVNNTANIDSWFTTIDKKNLKTPNASAYSLVPATNNDQTLSGVRPIPTTSTYVYQPLDGTGALCSVQANCRNFTLYYLLETNATVQTITSKNQ